MASEVAEMLGGVGRTRLYAITTRPGFPEPIGVLRGGRVWDRSEVEAWIRANRSQGEDALS